MRMTQCCWLKGIGSLARRLKQPNKWKKEEEGGGGRRRKGREGGAGQACEGLNAAATDVTNWRQSKRCVHSL